MDRSEKEREIEQLGETVGGAAHAFLVDFTGLDVAGATDLRRQLRDSEAQLRVVKNRLALRAFVDTPLAELQEAFRGQTAIAYSDDDVVALAKTLRTFAKEHEVPKVKAGIVDGRPVSPDQFEEIAELPPRDELLAKALWLMQYPLQGLANTLDGVMRNFVVVVEQIRAQKEAADGS